MSDTPPSSVAGRRRELAEYPSPSRRAACLFVVTVATTVTFYLIYLQGALSPLLIADFDIPLWTFVLVSVVGNAIGAAAAWAAGLADRWGRCNLVLCGLAIAAVLAGVVLPAMSDIASYLVVYAGLSLVGGVVLVTTSALVRDFSPQMGRATAMGVWALGPSLGSLLISAITSDMVPDHPAWEYHFRVAGVFGAVAFVVAFVGLRELSPALRDQVMVTARERALVEARARSSSGTVTTGVNSMWVPALVIPAVGIGLFLMFYATRVGFFVLYFVANFGYDPSRANGLASWYWVASAIALVTAGVVSDRLRVRKPLLLGGALVSAAALAVFADRATKPDTSYEEFVVLLVLLAGAGGTVATTWLALFTETVERIDPTAIARGMAVYGAVVRGFVVAVLLAFMALVSAPAVLVNHGERVAAISKQHALGLRTIGLLEPELFAAHKADPEDKKVKSRAIAQLGALDDARAGLRAARAIPDGDLAYVARHGAAVQAAVTEGPREWRQWWWICFVGQLLVLPLSLRMPGRWHPGRAAQDARAHERRVAEEIAKLHPAPSPGPAPV
ncbi:MFS transporter [Paraconexibacter algicola]|uniref:MFS transporter n=1 Tax=Paraconexibacter algicola TaxID=2133960 RepID=A0A2T4UKL5_9ACTN|nr:MFS transporter [Paraconexibacter algicola]PTL59757.1 MFS transporter [Paraconexibacter algicola]